MIQFIQVHEKNNVAQVVLSRPEVRNAFNPEMISEIQSTFAKLSHRADLRALVLRGEGKVFCAGGDLNWMKSMINFSLEENQKDAAQLFNMFETVFNCPIPIIGMVHGAAFGGALGLIACCDYVICEEKTQLCFSEAKLGIAPAVISSFVLRKASLGFVLPLMLMANTFDARTAQMAGLVHAIADEDALNDRMETALAWCKEVGPEAVRTGKRLLHRIDKMTWNDIRDEVVEVIAERRVSPEGQEGIKSFLEKRRAAWTKK